MPRDLKTFDNLVPINAEGYFNDLEQNLVQHIKNEGEGFYKLTQAKTGAFVHAWKVSEINEESFIVNGGLLTVIGPDHLDFHYGYFY